MTTGKRELTLNSVLWLESKVAICVDAWKYTTDEWLLQLPAFQKTLCDYKMTCCMERWNDEIKAGSLFQLQIFHQ